MVVVTRSNKDPRYRIFFSGKVMLTNGWSSRICFFFLMWTTQLFYTNEKWKNRFFFLQQISEIFYMTCIVYVELAFTIKVGQL